MARKTSHWLSAATAFLLLAALLPTGGSTLAQTQSQTFPQTGKTVSGKFLTYWRDHGGLAQQGYPISGEMQEKSDTDGKTYTVQYFERAVFEAHPEKAAPYDVLLSLVGNFYFNRRHPNGAPEQKATTAADAVLFKETGKHVGGKFLAYWKSHGGLAQQGYPISEEFQERSDLDGKTYTVQYFERAVFELHPENQAPFDVLLSQLGTFENKKKNSPAGAPITVGLLSDRSGSLSIYGPMFEQGFAVGLDYATGGTGKVMGHEIKVVTKDTASTVATGVALAREAVEKDGAKILIGVPSSGVALAVSALAAQNKIPYLAAPAGTPDLTGKNWNQYTFRTSRTSGQDALTMGSALNAMGKKFVQIAPDYAFGRGSAASFYQVVKAGGGQFVINDTADGAGTVFAPLDTTDFTPYLNQVLDSGAEVVIVTWAGAGFVPLFQQMQQLGIFDSMTVATGFGDNQTLAKGYADAVGSVGLLIYHYSLFDTPVNRLLVQRYNARYHTTPDLFSEEGFTAAQMLVRAIENTDGDPGAEGVIKAWEGMRFEGPKGTYIVRPGDHVLLQPMALAKLTNVKDPESKFFQIVKIYSPEETAPPCEVPAALNRCK
ncbi:MAG TPA: substrate-binding domain-containing protein [Chloroflexia bacterium]|nr:substrate-binding domain-containing protein [Chloroflexia bacterium]